MDTKENSQVVGPKSGYTPPVVPAGYDQPAAFLYADGEWALDFVNHERCDFASENMDVDIPWPWPDNYRPTDADWEALGFFTLYE